MDDDVPPDLCTFLVSLTPIRLTRVFICLINLSGSVFFYCQTHCAELLFIEFTNLIIKQLIVGVDLQKAAV